MIHKHQSKSGVSKLFQARGVTIEKNLKGTYGGVEGFLSSSLMTADEMLLDAMSTLETVSVNPASLGLTNHYQPL
jgi:hypothetical protein